VNLILRITNESVAAARKRTRASKNVRAVVKKPYRIEPDGCSD
jgi:hypothetical protein